MIRLFHLILILKVLGIFRKCKWTKPNQTKEFLFYSFDTQLQLLVKPIEEIILFFKKQKFYMFQPRPGQRQL